MRVAAVVVTYNRKELLLENIRNLSAQTRSDALDIIIVDNASTDGTKESLSDVIESKRIIYINTGSNLGGAGGFHFGIKYAAEKNYDHVWIMDDDCMPRRDALEQFILWDSKLKGQYGFLSSKVLWKDNSICKMNVQRQTLTRYVSDFSSEKVKISMASFVSLFISTDIIRKVGLPIKEFFIWTDDWEYTRRISLKYPCYLINSSVVVHKSASNIGANIATDSKDRLERYNYLYRNDIYLYRREGIKGFLYEFVRLTGHALRVILKAENEKTKRLKIIFKASCDGMKFDPDIEYIKKAE